MEWNLSELKRRGKEKFMANYFYCLVAAFILSIALGGAAGSSASTAGRRVVGAVTGTFAANTGSTVQDVEKMTDEFAVDGLSEEELEEIKRIMKEKGITEADLRKVEQRLKEEGISDADIQDLKQSIGSIVAEGGLEMLMVIVTAIIGILVIASIVSFLVDIMVLNPLEVGCQYFFLRNAEGDSELTNIGRGFSPNWGANVGTMLLRNIYLWLWGLLCGIPGLIKSYSYRMVPYIIAEHPEMGANEAITLSRRMMDGYKMKAFILDLSFIGWYLLSIITCGILLVFYVQPYKACTDAEIYCLLKRNFPELNPPAASYTDPYANTYNNNYGDANQGTYIQQ